MKTNKMVTNGASFALPVGTLTAFLLTTDSLSVHVVSLLWTQITLK